jgi:hypothetical protein
MYGVGERRMHESIIITLSHLIRYYMDEYVRSVVLKFVRLLPTFSPENLSKPTRFNIYRANKLYQKNQS